MTPEDFADLAGCELRRTGERPYLPSVREPHVALPALLERLEKLGTPLTGLTTRHASLEDVFVKLAGRHLTEADNCRPTRIECRIKRTKS